MVSGHSVGHRRPKYFFFTELLSKCSTIDNACWRRSKRGGWSTLPGGTEFPWQCYLVVNLEKGLSNIQFYLKSKSCKWGRNQCSLGSKAFRIRLYIGVCVSDLWARFVFFFYCLLSSPWRNMQNATFVHWVFLSFQKDTNYITFLVLEYTPTQIPPGIRYNLDWIICRG